MGENEKPIENIDNNEPKRISKRKIVAISGIVFGGILALLFILSIFSVGYTKIYNGVSINGIKVGGKSISDAAEIIERNYEKLSNVDVSIICADDEISFSGKDINAKMDSLDAAMKAYNVGREGKIFNRIFVGLWYRMSHKNFRYDITYNRSKMDTQIAKLVNIVEKESIQPTYTRERDKLIVQNGTTGIKIDKAKLTEDILVSFDGMKDTSITAGVTKVQPEKVSIEKIQKEITKTVKDAEYNDTEGVIVDQVIGVEIKDIEEAKKIAESVTEEGMQFSIDLLITLPETTTESVMNALFKDELSTYTTYFNVNEKERTENVKLAANFINDIILMPGQEFSYNTTVGERSSERGFKTAKVYQDGKVVDGMGGGICQVSSTLYNAAVMADLEITERRNHSLSVSYVKLGRDATVVYGVTDFKFKNNQQYPVKISSVISGGTLTIKIFGIDTKPERSVDIRTETKAVLPFAVKEIPDDTLYTEMRTVSQKGKTGYKVTSYRVTKENGVVVEEKLIGTDTYSPVAEIVKVGPSI